MRQLTVINVQAIKKFGLWAALLLAFSIPFPLRINSIAVVTFFSLFAVLTITQGDIRKEFMTSPVALLITLLFLIVVVGLLHTSDMQQGIRDIERSAFLIALLIIVYQLRNLGISAFRVMFSFTTACIVLTFYGLVVTFLNDKQQRILELGHASFPENISIHPTYLSVYLIFIFYFLLETLRKKRIELNKFSTYGIISILIYVVVLLVFLRSQMALLIFTMLFIVYIVIIFKKRAWLVTFTLFTIGFSPGVQYVLNLPFIIQPYQLKRIYAATVKLTVKIQFIGSPYGSHRAIDLNIFKNDLFIGCPCRNRSYHLCKITCCFSCYDCF